jgi:polyisoprenoid-binding protein YceI
MQVSANAGTAPSTWVIDQARSSLEFRVGYLTLSRVSGRFTRFQGKIHADPNDLEGAWAEVSIDPASIQTDQAARDRVLREDRFLEVEHFATCSYRARRLVSLGGRRYRLLGDLQLHGIKREVELELEASPPEVGSDGRRMRFTATGRIDRKCFGVDWNPLFDFVPIFISHLVDLKITVEGVELRA